MSSRVQLTRKKRLNSTSSPSSSSRTRTRTRIRVRQIARTRSRTNSNSGNSKRNIGELASEFESLTHRKCATCKEIIDGVLRRSDKGSALNYTCPCDHPRADGQPVTEPETRDDYIRRVHSREPKSSTDWAEKCTICSDKEQGVQEGGHSLVLQILHH